MPSAQHVHAQHVEWTPARRRNIPDIFPLPPAAELVRYCPCEVARPSRDAGPIGEGFSGLALSGKAPLVVGDKRFAAPTSNNLNTSKVFQKFLLTEN